MVMCTAMESVVIPRPPPIGALLKGNPNDTKRSSSSGFRLLENQDDTGSVYSVYKQKIDAMFESDSSSTKNSVQARIEKMFTDVAIDSGIPVNDFGCHSFSVDYLGSVPLNEKVTSLAGLQTPLKDLYFAYKRITRHKKQLTGRLEISAAGLKVQYQGEKGDLEQLNPFPTIAVWSAVKFVLQDDPKSSYAFLPLITDPDNIDKQQLFRSLEGSEKKYISSEYHSPLFAVVMRKIGVHKQLECHGFVCQTSEDAIVVAATLYKSLMSHMKAKEKKPKNRNGVTCMSVASSAFNENSVPVRPPRKKRSSASSVVSDIETIDTESAPLLNEQKSKKSVKTRRAPKAPDKQEEDLDAILPYEEPKNSDDDISPNKTKVHMGDNWNTFKNNHQKQITAEIKQMMSESSNMGLKRVKSLRRRSEDLTNSDNSGDILTKVTIPRSGSFLNAGGLTRYKSKMQRQNGLATGGSPLGFNELFNEFRLQEGLHSMDEILGVIIDPEGMSFNDLKPIYKEFLLKLSVTLTKDELYQRSKYIMRRHKKKLMRRKSALQAKKHNVVVGNKLKKLKHVFKKPKEIRVVDDVKSETKVAESTISSSSYDARQFAPREPTKKQSYKKRDSSKRDGQSTSEESDFFSLRKGRSSRNISHHRNSSSGYVSCSECSFDSDTCTCVSADKCYCSLGHKNFNKNKPKHKCGDLDNCDSLTYCGCDTDSCADSNKCYCTLGGATKSTIFEQLKHRGFFPSAESAITPPSARKLCKKYSNTKSTKSLEYMPNPAEIYYEKLAKRRAGAKMPINYGSCGFNNGTQFTNRSAIYLKSINEADHFCRDSFRSRFNEKRPFGLKGSIPGCSEALAVKKSAEIAALFADIKLSQTTDVSHIKPRVFDSTKSRFPSSRMIANSLYSSKSKADMYSAKNGLYTIQSQSDDSSRGARKTPKPDYLTSDNDYCKNVAGTNMENSLGYLP